MKLAIVLATYNGAKFIEDQLKSIQAQTVEDWFLLIRDDGSSDTTSDKINEFALQDHRITVLRDEFGNLGVTQNFSRLLQAALDEGADYVAMSDQDDIWHREKLQTLLNAMRKMDTSGDTSVPILVHSDLEVVDEAMNLLSGSFMDYAGISPEPLMLGHLLCQNDVTGCACLLNRPLLELALPIPKEVPIHDWWLVLLALSSGKVGYVGRALVRYRQHGRNAVGAEPGVGRILRYSLNPERWRRQIEGVRSSILQAGEIGKRLQARRVLSCGKGQLGLIEAYADLLGVSRLQRLRTIKAHRIQKRSMVSDALFKLIVFGLPLSLPGRH